MSSIQNNESGEPNIELSRIQRAMIATIVVLALAAIVAVAATSVALLAFQIKGVMGHPVGRPLFALTLTIGSLGILLGSVELFLSSNKERHKQRQALIGLAAVVTLIALAICFRHGPLSLHKFAKASLITQGVSAGVGIVLNRCARPKQPGQAQAAAPRNRTSNLNAAPWRQPPYLNAAPRNRTSYLNAALRNRTSHLH